MTTQKNRPSLDPALLRGERPTKTLTEILAVDTRRLLEGAFPALTLTDREGEQLTSTSITARMTAAGQLLHDRLGPDCIPQLHRHTADTVRGFAPYVVAAIPALDLRERLDRVRESADDPHFGVREWAWLAVRAHVASDIEGAIAHLEAWTADPSPRIRRFATEATRPRGVWSAKIQKLLDAPRLGLPLLEALRADPEKYVQDSVANWINDAAKSRPQWALDLCDRWRRESRGKSTERICTRALRSLK
ncbi:hypothetical protein [Chondromyces crocatus]|uniref:DNA alkylation repair protein n=1 Tax=Chondromyces crocatus TaxID=52 RepID=A0A0K1ENR0_CHOCO|nr:hypothetical protein [Chondromyces crocatus]AKT42491.1 DNA alkylation repair protein [Chondromyces crocatus]